MGENETQDVLGEQQLMPTTFNVPRIVTAALKGGAGKTLITAGLIAALRSRGLFVRAFKKGPDYIDAGWLGLASGSECYNLDKYLFDSEVVRASFVKRSVGNDVAVVEGNRGLYDGVDSAGSYSTADLAKLLRAPVVLIIDATKITRTAAALVLGCRIMDPELNLRGVILNRVAGARHEKVLRESIENACSVPVIGSVNKLALKNFPQRHLGLLPLQEHPAALEFIKDAGHIAEQFIDIDKLLEIASSACEFGSVQKKFGPGHDQHCQCHKGVRIGIIKDSAFQFYYPENLDALTVSGAELVMVSALETQELSDVDCLYIGGGFPETHAEKLANNVIFKRSLLKATEEGLPVYAECGGLMYLSRSLRIDETVFPMVGVFPVDTILKRKPQGLGYIRVRVEEANPFYPVGTVLSGHEFHYSSLVGLDCTGNSYVFKVLRGWGIDGSRDGICTRNVLGTYMHLHALGEPLWAQGILNRALEFKTAGDWRCRETFRKQVEKER